jgi:hypothetical protein
MTVGRAFQLDYDKLRLLDAEYLAEGGIQKRYDAMRDELLRYVPQVAEVEQVIDNDVPSYKVRCGSAKFVIYSSGAPDDQVQSWDRATHAFFAIVNNQLEDSEYRFYAINGGNDLGGMS